MALAKNAVGPLLRRLLALARNHRVQLESNFVRFIIMRHTVLRIRRLAVLKFMRHTVFLQAVRVLMETVRVLIETETVIVSIAAVQVP
jgi:hypothetical protein